MRACILRSQDRDERLKEGKEEEVCRGVARFGEGVTDGHADGFPESGSSVLGVGLSLASQRLRRSITSRGSRRRPRAGSRSFSACPGGVPQDENMCILDPLARNANMLIVIPPMEQIGMWKRSVCMLICLGHGVTMGVVGVVCQRGKTSLKEQEG